LRTCALQPPIILDRSTASPLPQLEPLTVTLSRTSQATQMPSADVPHSAAGTAFAPDTRPFCPWLEPSVYCIETNLLILISNLACPYMVGQNIADVTCSCTLAPFLSRFPGSIIQFRCIYLPCKYKLGPRLRQRRTHRASPPSFPSLSLRKLHYTAARTFGPHARLFINSQRSLILEPSLHYT
jgi:hypothetical protein